MCGIFGAIGERFNVACVRALAIANRERGRQSIGLFDNSGRAVKSATDPLSALARDDFAGFVGKASRKGWFISGHTRYATTGKVCDDNAHPFRFGQIIGSHNGMVHYPHDRKYSVDSQYLFDQLHRHNGNYQSALADIAGYWGLSWFDGAAFYLQAHDNTIALGRADDGVWYYSSDRAHLVACVGPVSNLRILQDGATVRFTLNDLNPQELPIFRSTVVAHGFDRARTGNGAGSTGRQGGSFAGSTPAKPGRKRRTLTQGALFDAGRELRPVDRAAELDREGYYDAAFLNGLAREAGHADFNDWFEHEGYSEGEELRCAIDLEEWVWELAGDGSAEDAEWLDSSDWRYR